MCDEKTDFRQSKICSACHRSFSEDEKDVLWLAPELGKFDSECILEMLIKLASTSKEVLDQLAFSMKDRNAIDSIIEDRHRGSAMDLADMLKSLVAVRNSALTMIQNISFQASLKRTGMKEPELPPLPEGTSE